MSFTAEATGTKPYRYERPHHGEFGRLAMVGNRLICHICGRDYLGLQTHVRGAHGLMAGEYKEAFGLNATTPLVAPSVSSRLREHALRRDQGHSPGATQNRARGSWSARARSHRRGATRAETRSHLSASIQRRLDGGWRPPRLRGAENPRAKLTDDDVRTIRASTTSGVSLGKQYGVSDVVISLIRRRVTWKHL